MKHVTIADMYALMYHMEFKAKGVEGVMDDDYETEVLHHLDNCSICRNRYEIKNDRVIDKVELYKKELINIYTTIIGEFTNEQINTDDENVQIIKRVLEKYYDKINFVAKKLNEMGVKQEELDKEINDNFGFLMGGKSFVK